MTRWKLSESEREEERIMRDYNILLLKEEIIRELSEKKLLDCENWKGGGVWSHFNDEEKDEISTAIIENIKRNPDGWEIKNVRTADYCMGRFSQWIFCPSFIRKPVFREVKKLLVHQSAQLQWNKDGFIVWDYSKMQPLTFLTPEQMTEVEQLFPTTSHAFTQISVYIEQVSTTIQQNLVFLLSVIVSSILLFFSALVKFRNFNKKRGKKTNQTALKLEDFG